MNSKQFATEVVHLTEQFRKNNPDHSEYLTQQYLEQDHIEQLFNVYQKVITHARSLGSNTIIDIGSGVGFAGVLDNTITLTNLVATDYDLFDDCFKHFGLECGVDLKLFKVRRKRNWITTSSKYDAVMLLRFMPFHHQLFNETDFYDLLIEMDRILSDTGVLFYWPIEYPIISKILDTYSINCSRLERTMVYIFTKSDVQDAIVKLKS